jgi:hypothetical protein
MKPVDSIKQTWNRQWPTASDHQERAERVAYILRIMLSMRRSQDRPIQDEPRGTLLNTYG